MARLSRAIALLLPAVVAAADATTSPGTELPQYFASYGMALSLSPAGTVAVSAAEYPIVPLTTGAGLNSTSLTTLDAISVKGALVKVDQSNYNLFNDTSRIAYVSCDPNTESSNISPSDVLNGLMDSATHPAAILLYTTNSAMTYCSLGGNDLTYQSIWSMVSSEDAWSVKNMTVAASTSTVEAVINGNGTSTSSGSGTASTGGSNSVVAMSILYSITGLITLLFLIIIATGAVRAHRHPERYGPRAGYGGRSRQSRARGLARAVLETLPIVKFGDPQPAKGDPDQELESVAGDRGVESPEPVHETAHRKSATPTAPVAVSKTTGSEVTPAPDIEGVGEEQLGCSICTEDFTVGEDVRVLPCDHKFHPACIDPWLVNVSGTCPLCRLDLRPQKSATDSRTSVEQGASVGADDAAVVPEPADNDRRRSRLLDWNRLRQAPVDERIQALREMREQGRSDEADTQEPPHNLKLTDRLREKFHIRTRTQS